MIGRLVECPADGSFESVAGGDQLGPLEDQPAVGPTATEPLVLGADRLVAPSTDVGKDRPNVVADPRIRDGSAPDEGLALVPGIRIGRPEDEPPEPELDRRVHGTIFSIGSTRMPEAPAALSRG